MSVRKVLIIVSPTWPHHSSGYGIAVSSSLKALASHGSISGIRLEFVAISSEDPPQGVASQFPHVSFRHIRIQESGLIERFARSLVTPYPALVMKYWNRRVNTDLATAASDIARSADRIGVLIEDVPCGVHFRMLDELLPGAQFALRSHNVISDIFVGVRDRTTGAGRLAWWLEVERARRFERRLLARIGRVWAITQDDAATYGRYGVSTSGVFGVSVDCSRYDEVAEGNAQTVLCLGSADVRKGQGLARFVAEVWPIVRDSFPTARLVLGGRDTEVFNDPDKGILGLGFVDSENKVLSEGAIFVNPQDAGSGIKLKSLTAMAARKVLVSTRIGVEGVGGVSGRTYYQCETSLEMGQRIVQLMGDRGLRLSVGAAGSEFVRSSFSQSRLAESARSICNALFA